MIITKDGAIASFQSTFSLAYWQLLQGSGYLCLCLVFVFSKRIGLIGISDPCREQIHCEVDYE